MTIALLISTYNRTPLLRRSLEALKGFTWPDELIVVDDGSSDGCDELCRELTRAGYPVTYVYNHRPWPANCCQARNVGLKLARCEDVLVCEPEVLFLTDVVAQLAQARLEHPDDVLYGWTYHENSEGSGIEDSERIGHFPFYTLFRRSWLLEVGGWDEQLPGPWAWDDVDLNGRLAEMGHNQFRVDECEALHQWHESRIELAVENEAHCRAKQWPADLIANQGVPWGVTKTA